MHLILDAWLERTDPEIRIIDSDTGREYKHFDAGEVQALIAQGDLSPQELLGPTANIDELIGLLLNS